MSTSTKSLSKEDKIKTMKTTSDSIGSSLSKNNANAKSGAANNVQISPSKVKLDVHT